MESSKLWIVLSPMLGIGAAVLTTIILQGMEVKADKSVPLVPPEDDAKGGVTEQRTVVVEAESGRLQALEAEVARLKSAMSTPARDEVPDVLTSEEAKVREQQRIADFEKRHSAERTDASWSREATSHLREGLLEMAPTAGFTVVSAECRSTLCRATLQWRDYNSALATGSRLPERQIPGLNCTTTIGLSEPSDARAAYSADFYLDCASLRSGQVENVPETTGAT